MSIMAITEISGFDVIRLKTVDRKRKVSTMKMWIRKNGQDAHVLTPYEPVGCGKLTASVSTPQAIGSEGVNALTDTSSGGDMPPLACRWLSRSIAIINDLP